MVDEVTAIKDDAGNLEHGRTCETCRYYTELMNKCVVFSLITQCLKALRAKCRVLYIAPKYSGFTECFT